MKLDNEQNYGHGEECTIRYEKKLWLLLALVLENSLLLVLHDDAHVVSSFGVQVMVVKVHQ